nr:MAG TPA: hypothetical protein [Caudoviricetes sp.]
MHSSFDFIFRHTLTYFTLFSCYNYFESEQSRKVVILCLKKKLLYNLHYQN